MRVESIAVLRWIDGPTLARGEEAVVAELEDALRAAVASQGVETQGPMRIRSTTVDEYPHAASGRPEHDPDAVLHLAEVDLV
jgi:hypothetical protein